MKTHVIHLEPFDDLISICDRIGWSKSARTLLVWPANGLIIRKSLDLVRLQRFAEKRGTQLAIVTSDDITAEIALTRKIPVFDTVKEAQRRSWRQIHRENSLQTKKLKTRNTKGVICEKQPKVSAPLNPWFRSILFFAAILSVVVLLLFFLPQAVVRIPLIENTQWVNLEVRGREDLSSPILNSMIRLENVRVIVEGRREAPATGSLSIPDRHAEGEVIFTNLTENEVDIPAGTVISTGGTDPVRFGTLQAGNLAGSINSQIQIPVRAITGGESGNVTIGDIQYVEGPTGLLVSVFNSEATQGGTNSIVPAPSQLDLDSLHALLITDLLQTAQQDLTRVIGEDQNLVIDSIELLRIIEEETNISINSPADSIQLHIQAEFSGLVYSRSDINTLSIFALDSQLSENMIGRNETLVVLPLVTEISDQGEISLFFRISRLIVSNWSPNRLAGLIIGTTPLSAVEIVQQNVNLRADPEIEIRPNGWFRMPFLPYQIHWIEE